MTQKRVSRILKDEQEDIQQSFLTDDQIFLTDDSNEGIHEEKVHEAIQVSVLIFKNKYLYTFPLKQQ